MPSLAENPHTVLQELLIKGAESTFPMALGCPCQPLLLCTQISLI